MLGLDIFLFVLLTFFCAMMVGVNEGDKNAKNASIIAAALLMFWTASMLYRIYF